MDKETRFDNMLYLTKKEMHRVKDKGWETILCETGTQKKQE